MLLVQLGINSTSDVWKFCQNMITYTNYNFKIFN
jgi:hypothetical protein